MQERSLFRSCLAPAVLGLLALSVGPDRAAAGSIFLTGHDPDFHAVEEHTNPEGARRINQVAIGFVMDPAHNPFTATAPKFLYVESSDHPPEGHVHGVSGIIASGFVEGLDFEHHDAGTLAAALDELGTTYSAIVVASDFGGVLRQEELDILDAHSVAIANFLNAGGGLYAMAQSGSGAGLTPNGGYFGFLPRVFPSASVGQVETGYTVTPYGQSLGLTNTDINGNFSHAVFDVGAGFAYSVVDRDAEGRIISLTSRDQVSPVPEAGTSALVTLALLGGFALRRRFRVRQPR